MRKSNHFASLFCTRNIRILGLGLYMANRKLSASVFATGTIATPEEQYVRSLVFLFSLLAIALISRIFDRNLTSGWVLFAGIGKTLGMLMIVYLANPFYLGSIISGLSFAGLTVCFTIIVCSSTDKKHLFSLAIAVFASVVAVCLSHFLHAEENPFVVAVLPTLIGLLFFLEKTPSNSSFEVTTTKQERRPTALAILGAISISYIMYSFLNGLALGNAFSPPNTTLITFIVVGAVMAAILITLSKKNVPSLEGFFVKFWPLAFILLILGLFGFSAALYPTTTPAISLAFSGLTLFHFCSWIVCPLVIRWAKMPIVFSCALISIICDGFFWRQLGQHFSEPDLAVFSVSSFGSITILFILVCMIVFISRKTRRLSELFETSSNNTEGILSHRFAGLTALGKKWGLSAREIEVASLSLYGYSASKIAEKLFISESTVRFHIRNIYKKGGIHSKQDLLDALNGNQT